MLIETPVTLSEAGDIIDADGDTVMILLTPSDNRYDDPTYLNEMVRLINGGAMWDRLEADTDATPCKYPCLRDDLADWQRDQPEDAE